MEKIWSESSILQLIAYEIWFRRLAEISCFTCMPAISKWVWDKPQLFFPNEFRVEVHSENQTSLHQWFMTNEAAINTHLLSAMQLRLNIITAVIYIIGFRPKWESVIRQNLASLTLKDRENGMYNVILYTLNWMMWQQCTQPGLHVKNIQPEMCCFGICEDTSLRWISSYLTLFLFKLPFVMEPTLNLCKAHQDMVHIHLGDAWVCCWHF